MEFAQNKDIEEIVTFYKEVIEAVNKTDIRLGWNIDIYPDQEFVARAVANHEMVLIRENEQIIAAAVVNSHVTPEYDLIDWEIKGPKEKLATIHALAVSPNVRGQKVSYRLLSDIEEYCRKQGYLAIHLDVIDTNIPAYKLYLRNGYTELAFVELFYEVVGTRQFWMMERILL